MVADWCRTVMLMVMKKKVKGPKASEAAQQDVEAIGRSHDRAGPRLRLPEWQVGPVVQRVDGVAGQAIEQAVLDHRARAALAFLGRLEDEVHRADHAGAAQGLVDLEPGEPRRTRHHAGRAPFLECELGMRMQVAAQRDQIGEQVLDRHSDGLERQRPASTASASSASVWKW